MRREDAEALAEIQRRSYARASASFRYAWPQEHALDADGLRRFLDERRYAVFATARPDGRAHAARSGTSSTGPRSGSRR